MQYGLVFFYSDATVEVVKQSQCIIRDGFCDGKDVEIKYKGTSYLAFILRTHETRSLLLNLLTDALHIIEAAPKDTDTWKRDLLNSLFEKLPEVHEEPDDEHLNQEESSHGRKRKIVNYSNLENETPELGPQEKKKKKSTTKGRPKSSSESLSDVSSTSSSSDDLEACQLEDEFSPVLKTKEVKSRKDNASFVKAAIKVDSSKKRSSSKQTSPRKDTPSSVKAAKVDSSKKRSSKQTSPRKDTPSSARAAKVDSSKKSSPKRTSPRKDTPSSARAAKVDSSKKSSPKRKSPRKDTPSSAKVVIKEGTSKKQSPLKRTSPRKGTPSGKAAKVLSSKKQLSSPKRTSPRKSNTPYSVKVVKVGSSSKRQSSPIIKRRTSPRKHTPSVKKTGASITRKLGQTGAKVPKQNLLCPNPKCAKVREELAALREEFGTIKAQLQKFQQQKGQCCADDLAEEVASGVVPLEIAQRKGMHELVQGSGVFIFKTQLALCRNAPSRTSLACRLLRVFFTPKELAEGRLSKRVTTKYAHLTLLDQRIITAIKAYASMTSFKDREEVKFGHKKGMAHAMTLCLQHHRASHMKIKKEEAEMNESPENKDEDDDNEDQEDEDDEDDEDDDMDDFQPIDHEELSDFE